MTSALALRCQFMVHRDALEKVEVFKYLGRMMAQDDNDVQAVRHQLRKARGTWARVGQVLRSENATPRVAAKFYKAVVQAVLLYGSERWNLTKAILAWLEGFHVQAAYRMVQVHRPRPVAGNQWEYPKMSDVLEECGMATIQHYIQKRRARIAIYIADWPILEACRQGNVCVVCIQGSGGGSRRCAWTSMMQLDQMSDSQPCSRTSFVGMEEVFLGHGGLFGLGE